MQLDLFRIKVFPRLGQPSLFDGDALPPSAALFAAIQEQPTTPVRRGVAWHIGNVEKLDDYGLYFRLGKQARATLSLIDAAGNFTEAQFENAPYTHALIDTELEVCALAHNTLLAPTTLGIARRLSTVLNESATATDNRLRFSVDPISNPEEFLALIEAAHSISSFTFKFQRRNPIDTDKLFVEPFERLVTEAEGTDGQATINGPDLNKAPLQRITRSAAATGDDAKARLRVDAESTPVTRSLRGNSATVGVSEIGTVIDKREALRRMRELYRRIRGTNV